MFSPLSKAIIVGFIVAAAIPAVVFVLVEIASGRSEWMSALTWLLLAANIYFWSLATMGVFAFPIFLLFRRYKLIRWWSALGVGAVIGVVMEIIIMVPNSRELHELVTFSLAGAASGLAFWLVWRMGRE